MNKKQRKYSEGAALITIGLVVHLTVDRDFAFYVAVGLIVVGMFISYKAHKMEAE